jgi:hypothetical protein
MWMKTPHCYSDQRPAAAAGLQGNTKNGNIIIDQPSTARFFALYTLTRERQVFPKP